LQHFVGLSGFNTAKAGACPRLKQWAHPGFAAIAILSTNATSCNRQLFEKERIYAISKSFSYSGMGLKVSDFCRNIMLKFIAHSPDQFAMKVKIKSLALLLLPAAAVSFISSSENTWESKFVKLKKDGTFIYTQDEQKNIIPDFSKVGYYGGDKQIPLVPIVKTVSSSGTGNDETTIQQAIDEVSQRPLDKNGFRGAILLKKGVYSIPNGLQIRASGVVLRGEGNTENATKIIALTKTQNALITVSGSGEIKEIPSTRVKITDSYVPVGKNSFSVASAKGFKKGDKIILYRPGTDAWIKDLKMDQIESRGGTRQWTAKEYNLSFERVISNVAGNVVTIDNPVVFAMDAKYGGGEIFKYNFEGRLSQVGIENLYCESAYEKDTSENHSWDAITFNKIENSWVQKVSARYFAYSCVNLGSLAKNISVLDSKCFDHKSVITGGRRYSFCNNGQLNLFMNCHASDGRHDFVTGARVLGPNVFVNCTAVNTHADIGPHHRWSAGTLYDNVQTDGEINIQDRGNWGSGHGWAGVTQVVWNCTVKRAAVQNPWASGKNYCIGLQGGKYEGRLKGRPDAEWEGQNEKGLQPASLYMAQLEARKKSKP
jgi:hypothetical protein